MGTLGWKIFRLEGLVVVRGKGVLDLAFITSFRAAMRAEGAVEYCKLFDVSRAHIQLCEDREVMAASSRPVSGKIHGPIAIVLGQTPSHLQVDMAVLLKSRLGNRRRLRLFKDESVARAWLFSEEIIFTLSSGPLGLFPRRGMAGCI